MIPLLYLHLPLSAFATIVIEFDKTHINQKKKENLNLIIGGPWSCGVSIIAPFYNSGGS